MIAQIAVHTSTLLVTQLVNSTRKIKPKIRFVEPCCRMVACYLFTVSRCDKFSDVTYFPRVPTENMLQSRENLEVRRIFRVRQIFHDTGTDTST